MQTNNEYNSNLNNLHLDNLSKRQSWLLKNRIPLLVEHLKQKEKVLVEPLEALNIFCSADPSPNDSAVQWLIDGYQRNGFLWEDIESGKTSKVFETLTWFNQFKNRLEQDKRSLYHHKILADLYNAIKDFLPRNLTDTSDQENNKENDVENNLFLSNTSLKREQKLLALDDTLILFNNSLVKIVIPLTHEAAKWWGQGTRWCTSGNSPGFFEKYNQQAPLIITLFKDHEGKNRRLQFWVTDMSFQFMDESDASVEKEFIELNWNSLKSLFFYIFSIKPGELLDYLPRSSFTKNLVQKLISNDIKNFQKIPERFKTDELCLFAVKQSGLCLKDVPNYCLSYNLCKIAVQTDGRSLEFVPRRYKNNELYKIAVAQDGNAIEFVPMKFGIFLKNKNFVEEMCTIACHQTGLALKYVPLELATTRLCMQALKQNGLGLAYIPERYKTYDLCLQAVKQNGQALNAVPDYLKNQKLCEIAVENSAFSLMFVPKNLKSQQLCTLAVKKNPKTLQFIDQDLQTESLCKLAVEQDITLLHYVNDHIANLVSFKQLWNKSLSDYIYNKNSLGNNHFNKTKWTEEQVKNNFDQGLELMVDFDQNNINSNILNKKFGYIN